ncbi:hypothetical protein D623_10031299 [Myotis brandtii]|uniref:Uncharacterized protein n=1 Tax=Myotis brandtii TaxID=109478 RepID=S7PX71_MYOBR|nr:hypothetical protein D623_10031299 [Myotis brandtii]
MSKATTRVKGAHQGSSRKKASPKTHRSSVKSKKSRRAARHGHYPKVNEALHRNENEPKTTAKVKRPLRGSSRKKASPRSSRPSIKSKRSRGPILYGHYHRLHEALKRYENEPEEDQESMQKPSTSNSYRGSWNF